MSRILYFDCFAGASGDMVLGALLDAGLPLDDLRAALGSLRVAASDIGVERVSRAGLAATKFHVHGEGWPAQAAVGGRRQPHAHDGHDGHDGTDEHLQAHRHHHDHPHPTGAPQPEPAPTSEHRHEHRSLSEIVALIDMSALSARGKQRAKDLFRRLAQVEASIHQMPLEAVHLHEVGALDSIVDIVGTVFALEWFKADTIVASPLNVGGGMVHSAHGLFPVPAPATVALLAGAPIYSSGVQAELVTPTGALLITGYATSYGPVPAMTLEQVGYGAGARDLPDTPNVLRVLVGTGSSHPLREQVLVIECEIDDMNPQIFGVLMERLYAARALEVFYAPVQMKKNRPGTLVTIVAAPERRDALAAIVFQETTTIGLRYHQMERECLDRETVSIQTPVGVVGVKIARRGGSIVNVAPEFEDCARLAAERRLSVKEVQAMAMKAYLDRPNPQSPIPNP